MTLTARHPGPTPPTPADRPAVSARAIAFYLPQFHPVPENSDWWEPGFTEWTKVVRARPLFRDHRQPVLPTDLGYYDLRVPETRRAQADLAVRAGVEGFCYWHYWFAGRRILERIFDEVLASGEPDFPFMLGWANQTWTGVWHGAPGRILIEQTYPGADDYAAHFAHVLPAFRDRRYMRVDGRPMFYVYDPLDLPEPAAFVALWRRAANEAGLPGLYLIAESKAPGPARDASLLAMGFDAVAQVRLPPLLTPTRNPLRRAKRRASGRRYVGSDGPTRYEYRRLVPDLVQPDVRDPRIHPCVIPRWDNSPRSGRRARVLQGATPDLFREQVRTAADLLADKPAEHRLLLIKSWNEWAETNHLEPDDQWGHGFLDALRDGLSPSVP